MIRSTSSSSHRPSSLSTRSLLFFSLIAASALALTGCGKKDEAKAAEKVPEKSEVPRPVRVITAGESDVIDISYLPGEVRARYEQRYGFRVPGKIARRAVDVGQEVKAGQLLAVLDSQDVLPTINAQAAQVEVARTDVVFQQSELKRQTELREKGFVSGAALERQKAATDAALARMNAAKSQLASAQNGLSFQSLRADKAGVVVGVDAEAGSVVSAGQSVIRVAQLGEREVLVNAPERAVAQIKKAIGFAVIFDALPGKVVRAKLRELSPSADPASRTFAARLTLLDAGDDVKLGMSATVRGELGAAKSIVVPNSALYTRDNTTRVWVVNRASETVNAVDVKLGETTNDGIVVASGLKAGDTVVTAGANLLQVGQKVRVIDLAATAPTAAPTATPSGTSLQATPSGANSAGASAKKSDVSNSATNSNVAPVKEAQKP